MFNRKLARHSLNRILLDYINKIPLSFNVKRVWIRSLHYVLPPLQILLVTFGNKLQFYLGITISVVIMFLFILLNGCILSSLENSLFDDNSNIADIVLELLKVNKNRHNQVRITQVFFILWIIYVTFIYNYRFT